MAFFLGIAAKSTYTANVFDIACSEFNTNEIGIRLLQILKLSSKSLAKMTLEESENAENELLERRENNENEALEHKFLAMKEHQYECAENAVNENWENWDACYVCAGGFCGCRVYPHRQQPRYQSANSICYVFMPGQAEPVPVKLRTARIPGGVMWISYRPDVDIRSADGYYTYTSSQIPQAQHPTLV